MLEQNVIDWTRDWKQQGLEEGRRQGEATLLLLQLERRFGPLGTAVEERIAGADAERLLVWGERLLAAKDLEEVFEPA